MRYLFIFLVLLFSTQLDAQTTDCPEKIKWKKLYEAKDVEIILLKCLPLKSDKAKVISFLEKNKCVFSNPDPGTTIYATASAKSKSMWIEKKWMMEFILDENDLLKEIKVTAGLTGP